MEIMNFFRCCFFLEKKKQICDNIVGAEYSRQVKSAIKARAVPKVPTQISSKSFKRTKYYFKCAEY